MTTQAWLTADELAQFFKIKKPTVRLWTRQGVPCLKAGRLVRFNIDEVERWLRERGGSDGRAHR